MRKLSRNRPRPTDFEVEPRPAERSAALLRLHDMHTAWSERELAGGIGFHPDEHPSHSDYNVHSPDLDADGAAEDDFARAAAEAMTEPIPTKLTGRRSALKAFESK